jgi:hypothetical protein
MSPVDVETAVRSPKSLVLARKASQSGRVRIGKAYDGSRSPYPQRTPPR